MIKAYIFDLDDTFYNCFDLNNEAVEAVCKYAAKELLGRTETEVRSAFNCARDIIKEQIKEDVAARHNRMLYMEKTLELLNIPSVKYALEMYNYFWNYVLSHMVLFDGVVTFLQTLRADGIKIAICTDMTVWIQHKKLRALGIADYIDYIVTSEEAGHEKPDFSMYEMALAKLGVTKEEAVYVGDSLTKDVKGPADYGILPIWYTNNEEKDTEYLHAKSYVEMQELYQMLIKKN